MEQHERAASQRILAPGGNTSTGLRQRKKFGLLRQTKRLAWRGAHAVV
jgi:hypothetical protein